MPIDENELAENHKRYRKRIALYREYGYDVDEERNLVIEKAMPISGNILEAGTGKGYFSLALARRGFSFTTVDVSPSEQWYAGLNLGFYGLASRVRFDVADLEHLPYADASYDVIFAVHLVHHLALIEPACSEILRVLSPSGKIVLSDFNEKGRAVVDQIHALDGKKHEVGPVTLEAVKDYLTDRGLWVEKNEATHQDVLIASRP